MLGHLARDMSAIVDSGAPLNGVTAPLSHGINEVLEYEKILKIRDQVFTGSHPRLTVPANVIRKVSPRSAQPLSQPQPSVPTSASIQPQKVDLPGLHLNSTAEQFPPGLPLPNGLPTGPRPNPSHSAVSEIDPILLTKSDDLVKAELQLQRQRIERNLRDQLDRKRNNARHKTSPQEAKPDFDVSDVLARALDIAKPVTFDELRGGNDNVSASDSFDENSFYSSKAPDSTPRDRAGMPPSPVPKHQVQPVEMDDLDADELVDHPTNEARQFDLTDSPYKINRRPDFQTSFHNQDSRQMNHARAPPPNEVYDTTAMHVEDDEDEPEYFPPEPIEQYSERTMGNQSSKRGLEEQGRRPNGRYPTQFQGRRRYGSPPESGIRIVRSHITSPIAPQPARVSPLAMAKAPRISQNRRPQQGPTQQRRMSGLESLRTSPEISVQTIQPRKKRKVENKKTARKRTAASPEVVIKDEPVSPPPFHDVQPLGATRQRQTANRPIYIDVDPPREVRYLPAHERRAELSPRQVVYDIEAPLPHSDPRPYSRSALRELPRDDQDLRRMASLQQMRVDAHRDDLEASFKTPSRLSRAPSHTVLDGGALPGHKRIYHETVQGVERPLERPVERSAAREERIMQSPVYRESDFEARYNPQPLAPPQRRIVVDQDGNQFYEMVHHQRSSIIPPSTRQIDLESYNEGASARNGGLRATSVFADPYREGRYIQEMPPPQVSYRRVADAPRNVITESRPTPKEAFDPRHIQRSASVQIVDYPARQPVYIDSRPVPREVVRMSSVRPGMSSYQDPTEVVQRVQNTRPEGREHSVFVDDRPRLRREYMPVETPTYEVRRAVPEDGYYEVEEGGRMMLDGTAVGRQPFARPY